MNSPELACRTCGGRGMVDSPSGIKACPRCIAGVTPSHEPEPLIWQFCIGPVGPNDRGWCECTESKARAFLAHGAPFVVRALRVVPITDGVKVVQALSTDETLLRRALFYLEAEVISKYGPRGLEDMVNAGDHPVVADLRKRLAPGVAVLDHQTQRQSSNQRDEKE